MLTACPWASGTTGCSVSIRAPATWSGVCGPGRLVMTTLNRWRLSSPTARAPRACTGGGTRLASVMSASVGPDGPAFLCRCSRSLTCASRRSGSGSPSGRSTK